MNLQNHVFDFTLMFCKYCRLSLKDYRNTNAPCTKAMEEVE